MSDDTGTKPVRCFVLNLGLLSAALTLEAVFYPAMATTIYGWLGGEGGPGSSMGYFQSVYVVPASVGMALASALVLALASRRGHRALHRSVVTLWFVNAGTLVASALWYFSRIRAAGSLLS